MIDLHSHILPGLDDGAATEEDTLAMAKAAVKEGITQIVATPHHQNGTYENEAPIIDEAVIQANELLKQHHIDLTILPGQEVRLYGELIEDLKEGKLLPLNHSSYLFIEFPSGQVPRYTSQMLYDLQMEKITPIIVHPERNKVLIEKPEMLYRFVQNGALTQVTAASLTGKFGKAIQKFSLQLVEHDLTHVVASDAHNTSSRGFETKAACEILDERMGESVTGRLLYNAEAVIQNNHPDLNPPTEIQSKGLFGKLFKR